MSGFILRPIRPAKFVDTSVALNIKSATAFALRTCGAVVIRGPAGIGKSSALADIMKLDPSACAFEVTQNSKTIKRILEGVAEAFGIHHSRAYSADLMSVLSHRLPDYAAKGHYLIVDEVQNVGLDGIRQLLTFNEHYGLPIVLCGNHAAIKMTRANEAVFDQINDRVAKIYDLEPPAPTDVQLIAIEHGVEGAEAYRLFERYGAETSIRRTVKLLEVARVIVGQEGSIQADHIRGAVVFMDDGNPRLLQVLQTAS